MPRVTGYIIETPGTKTTWPPPPAEAASSALNIPLAEMGSFLTDASEQDVLDDARSANG